MKAYLVEVGVLLPADHEEYGAYSCSYDHKHGFYDENQYYCPTKEQAIKEVSDYVKAGVDQTYGIVSETYVSDDIDFDDCCVEGESYNVNDVEYSVMKSGEELKENFLEV